MLLVEELQKKTVFELKSYAKKNNIDILGSTTKSEILEVILNWVPIEEFPNQEIKSVKKESSKKSKDIALHSTRNLFWNEIGELKTGYNIVSKEASEKWLTHKAVRLATPEEIASYYGTN